MELSEDIVKYEVAPNMRLAQIYGQRNENKLWKEIWERESTMRFDTTEFLILAISLDNVDMYKDYSDDGTHTPGEKIANLMYMMNVIIQSAAFDMLTYIIKNEINGDNKEKFEKFFGNYIESKDFHGSHGQGDSSYVYDDKTWLFHLDDEAFRVVIDLMHEYMGYGIHRKFMLNMLDHHATDEEWVENLVKFMNKYYKVYGEIEAEGAYDLISELSDHLSIEDIHKYFIHFGHRFDRKFLYDGSTMEVFS